MSAEAVLNKLNIITDINPNFLNTVTTPNQAYVATILKLQFTTSNPEDICNLRLKNTEFNLELAKLILDEICIARPPSKIQTKGDYIHIQLFSSSFIKSLSDFDLKTIPSSLYPHMLRAIVELRFKVNTKNKSLQFTTKDRFIIGMISDIVYKTHDINSIHIRTTPSLTCIRFKLYPNDNNLLHYLYPSDQTTSYIHDPIMVNAIKHFDS